MGGPEKNIGYSWLDSLKVVIEEAETFEGALDAVMETEGIPQVVIVNGQRYGVSDDPASGRLTIPLE